MDGGKRLIMGPVPRNPQSKVEKLTTFINNNAMHMLFVTRSESNHKRHTTQLYWNTKYNKRQKSKRYNKMMVQVQYGRVTTPFVRFSSLLQRLTN